MITFTIASNSTTTARGKKQFISLPVLARLSHSVYYLSLVCQLCSNTAWQLNEWPFVFLIQWLQIWKILTPTQGDGPCNARCISLLTYIACRCSGLIKISLKEIGLTPSDSSLLNRFPRTCRWQSRLQSANVLHFTCIWSRCSIKPRKTILLMVIFLQGVFTVPVDLTVTVVSLR